tara:strand:- start:132 stop:1322 length:1191 start_codon:yes stop_codon:yes gene_type:complete
MKKINQSPTDPKFVQNPYQFYQRILEFNEVCFWEDYKFKAFFDFQTINKIFRDKRFGREIPDRLYKLNPKHLDDFFRVEKNSMLELEAPRHTRLRSLVLRAFTTKNIKSLENQIEELCFNLLSKMSSTNVNLIEEYAKKVPVITIANLLGIPEEMSDQLVDWSNKMVTMYQARLSPNLESTANKAARDFFSYIENYVYKRKDTPEDDLITHLINAEQDGSKLNFDELISTCILLLNAGHEATVHTIGNGIKTLLEENIDTKYFLKNHSQSVVEEILRFDPPLHIFTRYAYENIKITDTEIKEGEKIGLIIGASGYDRKIWEQPEKFIPDRKILNNNSFGAGIHFCIGAPLARLEINIAIKCFFEVFQKSNLVEKPQYADIYHFHGLDALKVKLNQR